MIFGGEGGIRTHEGLQTLAGFQDQCIQPLCHLSEGKLLMRRRIVVAGRKYFNNRKYLSIIDRAGLMTHIPVRHPYGVASRSKFAPGEFVEPTKGYKPLLVFKTRD